MTRLLVVIHLPYQRATPVSRQVYILLYRCLYTSTMVAMIQLSGTQQPLKYATTTKMEPCNTNRIILHLMYSHNVDATILYAQLRTTIRPFVNETIDNCSAQIEALVCFSSGNFRHGCDLIYNLYMKATLSIVYRF